MEIIKAPLGETKWYEIPALASSYLIHENSKDKQHLVLFHPPGFGMGFFRRGFWPANSQVESYATLAGLIGTFTQDGQHIIGLLEHKDIIIIEGANSLMRSDEFAEVLRRGVVSKQLPAGKIMYNISATLWMITSCPRIDGPWKMIQLVPNLEKLTEPYRGAQNE